MKIVIRRGRFRRRLTDNFARNRNWEAIFDRLVEMRERDGIDVHLVIQVDTLCYRIPRFIEKAARAGVKRVFIGLENINPDNLLQAKKKQNRVHEYRKLFLEWRAHGVITFAGYILGFPNDTPDRIARDIKTVQEQLPVDMLEFFILTPLPGSEDHQKLHKAAVWMDPDMRRTTRHFRRQPSRWQPPRPEPAWTYDWRDHKGQLRVYLSRPMVVRRMTGIGATASLPYRLAKVRSRKPKRSSRPAGTGGSSCPFCDIRRPPPAR